jgi:hypothetical protein
MSEAGIKPMALLTFFKECKRALVRAGKADDAFYFEQIEDYLQSGKDLRSESINHILGL